MGVAPPRWQGCSGKMLIRQLLLLTCLLLLHADAASMTSSLPSIYLLMMRSFSSDLWIPVCLTSIDSAILQAVRDFALIQLDALTNQLRFEYELPKEPMAIFKTSSASGIRVWVKSPDRKLGRQPGNRKNPLKWDEPRGTPLWTVTQNGQMLRHFGSLEEFHRYEIYCFFRLVSVSDFKKADYCIQRCQGATPTKLMDWFTLSPAKSSSASIYWSPVETVDAVSWFMLPWLLEHCPVAISAGWSINSNRLLKRNNRNYSAVELDSDNDLDPNELMSRLHGLVRFRRLIPVSDPFQVPPSDPIQIVVNLKGGESVILDSITDVKSAQQAMGSCKQIHVESIKSLSIGRRKSLQPDHDDSLIISKVKGVSLHQLAHAWLHHVILTSSNVLLLTIFPEASSFNLFMIVPKGLGLENRIALSLALRHFMLYVTGSNSYPVAIGGNGAIFPAEASQEYTGYKSKLAELDASITSSAESEQQKGDFFQTMEQLSKGGISPKQKVYVKSPNAPDAIELVKAEDGSCLFGPSKEQVNVEWLLLLEDRLHFDTVFEFTAFIPMAEVPALWTRLLSVDLYLLVKVMGIRILPGLTHGLVKIIQSGDASAQEQDLLKRSLKQLLPAKTPLIGPSSSKWQLSCRQPIDGISNFYLNDRLIGQFSTHFRSCLKPNELMPADQWYGMEKMAGGAQPIRRLRFQLPLSPQIEGRYLSTALREAIAFIDYHRSRWGHRNGQMEWELEVYGDIEFQAKSLLSLALFRLHHFAPLELAPAQWSFSISGSTNGLMTTTTTSKVFIYKPSDMEIRLQAVDIDLTKQFSLKICNEKAPVEANPKSKLLLVLLKSHPIDSPVSEVMAPLWHYFRRHSRRDYIHAFGFHQGINEQRTNAIAVELATPLDGLPATDHRIKELAQSLWLWAIGCGFEKDASLAYIVGQSAHAVDTCEPRLQALFDSLVVLEDVPINQPLAIPDVFLQWLPGSNPIQIGERPASLSFDLLPTIWWTRPGWTPHSLHSSSSSILRTSFTVNSILQLPASRTLQPPEGFLSCASIVGVRRSPLKEDLNCLLYTVYHQGREKAEVRLLVQTMNGEIYNYSDADVILANDFALGVSSGANNAFSLTVSPFFVASDQRHALFDTPISIGASLKIISRSSSMMIMSIYEHGINLVFDLVPNPVQSFSMTMSADDVLDMKDNLVALLNLLKHECCSQMDEDVPLADRIEILQKNEHWLIQIWWSAPLATDAQERFASLLSLYFWEELAKSFIDTEKMPNDSSWSIEVTDGFEGVLNSMTTHSSPRALKEHLYGLLQPLENSTTSMQSICFKRHDSQTLEKVKILLDSDFDLESVEAIIPALFLFAHIISAIRFEDGELEITLANSKDCDQFLKWLLATLESLDLSVLDMICLDGSSALSKRLLSWLSYQHSRLATPIQTTTKPPKKVNIDLHPSCYLWTADGWSRAMKLPREEHLGDLSDVVKHAQLLVVAESTLAILPYVLSSANGDLWQVGQMQLSSQLFSSCIRNLLTLLAFDEEDQSALIASYNGSDSTFTITIISRRGAAESLIEKAQAIYEEDVVMVEDFTPIQLHRIEPTPKEYYACIPESEHPTQLLLVSGRHLDDLRQRPGSPLNLLLSPAGLLQHSPNKTLPLWWCFSDRIQDLRDPMPHEFEFFCPLDKVWYAQQVKGISGWKGMKLVGVSFRLEPSQNGIVSMDLKVRMDKSLPHAHLHLDHQVRSAIVDALLWDTPPAYQKLPAELNSQLQITVDGMPVEPTRQAWYESLLECESARPSIRMQRTLIAPPSTKSISFRLQVIVTKVAQEWQWFYLHRTLFDLMTRPSLNDFPTRNLLEVRLDAITKDRMVIEWKIFYQSTLGDLLNKMLATKPKRDANDREVPVLAYLYLELLLKIIMASASDIETVWLQPQGRPPSVVNYDQMHIYSQIDEMIGGMKLEFPSVQRQQEKEEEFMSDEDLHQFSPIYLAQHHDPWIILSGPDTRCIGHASYLIDNPQFTMQLPHGFKLLQILHLPRIMLSLGVGRQAEHAISFEIEGKDELSRLLAAIPSLLAGGDPHFLGIIIEPVSPPLVKPQLAFKDSNIKKQRPALRPRNVEIDVKATTAKPGLPSDNLKLSLWMTDAEMASSKVDWLAAQLGICKTRMHITPHSQALKFTHHPNPPCGHWIGHVGDQQQQQLHFFGQFEDVMVIIDALFWLQWLPQPGMSLELQLYEGDLKGVKFVETHHQIELSFQLGNPTLEQSVLAEAVKLFVHF